MESVGLARDGCNGGTSMMYYLDQHDESRTSLRAAQRGPGLSPGLSLSSESDDNVFVKEERAPAAVETPAPVKTHRISCCGLIY